MQLASDKRYKYATRPKNPTNDDNMIYYEKVLSTSYTAGADGETSIGLDIVAGAVSPRVIQVERNQQPMFNVDWGWNANALLLTLLNGNSLGQGESLFVIYSVIISK